MHQVAYLSVCLFLTGMFFVPQFSYAQTATEEQRYRVQLLEQIQSLLQQIEVLQSLLAQKQAAEINHSWSIFADTPIVERYVVTEASYQQTISNVQHKAYLKRIYDIFPGEFDKKLVEFVVFDGKDAEFDAFIETVPPTHESWSLAINSQILEEVDFESSTELIVHELGHIVAYEEILGVPVPSIARCADYFADKGCPKTNSYLAAFVDTFWSDADLVRATNFQTKDNPVEEAYVYYKTAKNDFVSSYAALNPEEDFSESFAQYVVNRGQQKSTIASQKVWWFEQFAELQTIRKGIQ